MGKYPLIILLLAFLLFVVLDHLMNQNLVVRSIKLTYESNRPNPLLDIYYSSTDVFTEEQSIKNLIPTPLGSNKYILLIDFEKSKKEACKLRFDPIFSDSSQYFSFKSLELINIDSAKAINVILNKDSYFSVNSISTLDQKDNLVFYPKHTELDFDPYIILRPMVEIAKRKQFIINEYLRVFCLLSIIVVLAIYFNNNRKDWPLYLSVFILVGSFYLSKQALTYSIWFFGFISIYTAVKKKGIQFTIRNIFKQRLIFWYSLIVFYYLVRSFIVGYQINSIETSLSLFIIPLIFSIVNPDYYERKRFLNVSILASLFMGTFYVISILLYWYDKDVSFTYLIRHSPALESYYFEWINPQFHHSFFIFNFSLSILLMLFSTNFSKLIKISYILLFTVLVMFLSARIGIVLYAVIVLLYLNEKFKIPKGRNTALVLLLGLIIAHLLLYSILFPKIDLTRLYLWKGNLQIIANNFWFGINPSNFRNYMQLYLDSDEIIKVSQFGHAHNQFLYFFTIGGVFIGLSFIIIHFYMIDVAIKSSNYLLLSFLLLVSIFMIFDLLLNSIKGVVPFSFYFSLLVYDQYKFFCSPLSQFNDFRITNE
jgi:hypothetical protein